MIGISLPAPSKDSSIHMVDRPDELASPKDLARSPDDAEAVANAMAKVGLD